MSDRRYDGGRGGYGRGGYGGGDRRGRGGGGGRGGRRGGGFGPPRSRGNNDEDDSRMLAYWRDRRDKRASLYKIECDGRIWARSPTPPDGLCPWFAVHPHSHLSGEAPDAEERADGHKGGESSDSDSSDDSSSRRRKHGKKKRSKKSKKHHKKHSKKHRHHKRRSSESRESSDDDDESGSDSDVSRRSRRHSKKHKKHKHKKHGKHKKRRHKDSSSDSGSEADGVRNGREDGAVVDGELPQKRHKAKGAGDDDEWVEAPPVPPQEKTASGDEDDDDEDDDVIGPAPPKTLKLNRATLGSHMLKGEADAIADYVEEGKRIPRRGEIGLTSNEISDYEAQGYIMSGSRNLRMEAVRLRKENEIYDAERQRQMALINQEAREKKNNALIAEMRDFLHKQHNKIVKEQHPTVAAKSP
ncbi:hypothetical protein PTSG_02045 [Salpingoeca rosetta]|uniref:NF-kappa-B-activating protein C-terminal domain-containing protein n=1 Tax=Salpingoeca rosetta (strain ATCC 50818 / BSB-021) TaxID=946362 RepID=F2TZQ3_SALR5|nr:uncharacterized protein PTSG_02045 [Salpingoeca rosetta]EGD79077.1 hypothetical protein PTSG_02045 [Salpingoeca rosetta]|eukprot:XP_004998033.1 hypothetical protein PTSG_02045 [Salpingoeca rosetta]